MNFVFLNQAPINHELLPNLPKDWIDAVNREFNNKEYDKHKNKYFAFSDKLCNQVYSKYKYWEKNETHADFFNKLTDEQKMYFALINFESQVNNGGVYQFLFNEPEISIIALEGMKKAGMDKLANDYELVLSQIFGKFNKTQDLKIMLQNPNSAWDKHWTSFFDEDKEIPGITIIEKYFDTEEYTKEFHKRMEDFVINNQAGLFETE